MSTRERERVARKHADGVLGASPHGTAIAIAARALGTPAVVVDAADDIVFVGATGSQMDVLGTTIDACGNPYASYIASDTVESGSPIRSYVFKLDPL